MGINGSGCLYILGSCRDVRLLVEIARVPFAFEKSSAIFYRLLCISSVMVSDIQFFKLSLGTNNFSSLVFQYWVSQGNKWCDLCKIFISNNPFSIRTHELGKRHKDNVTQRLSTMQKDGAAKEKEQQQAAKALQLIEAVS